MTPSTRLDRPFAAVRRRFVAIGAIAGACWGVAAAVVIVAAAVWLDLIWDLPPEARVATWGVVLVIALAVLFVWLGRAWQRARNAAIAIRLDAAAGTPGTIAAGWHLAHAAALPLPLSAGLASIAIKRAEHDAARVPRARVAPASAVSRGAIAACLGAAAVAGFTPPTDSAEEPTRRRPEQTPLSLSSPGTSRPGLPSGASGTIPSPRMSRRNFERTSAAAS